MTETNRRSSFGDVRLRSLHRVPICPAMHGKWWKVVVVAALLGCSSGSQKSPSDGSASGGTSGRSTGGANGTAPGTGGNTGANGTGGAPSPATDTNPANPHVTNAPPASPNGPTVTVQPGTGGVTGVGTGGGPAQTGGATGNGSGGVSGSATGGAPGNATGGARGGATGGASGGATGGAPGGIPGTGGAPGSAMADAGAPSSGPDTAVTGPNGGIPATWATVDCVGGPCGPPGVCVNLDFLFVACAHCGGVDEVCCPPYATSDPWLGTCGAGLACAHNPNFHSDPPLDLVQDVCQVPGSPPPADGGLNHERLQITN
jgi:hypothetical protein